jgi:hypothetical protein
MREAPMMPMTRFVCLLVPMALLLGVSAARASNGCDPTVDPAPVFTPDGKTITQLFSAFSAAPGLSSICNLAIPALLPDGTFAVYRSVYKGAVLAENGDTSTATLMVTNGTGAELNTTSTTSDGFADAAEIYHEGRLGLDGAGRVSGTIVLQVAGLDGFGSPPEATLESLDLVELGRTTLSSVTTSIAQLSDVQAGIVTNLDSEASRLLGADAPLQAPDGIALEGAIGSATLGLKANVNLQDGFSVQAGAALATEANASSSFTSLPLLALSLRYVEPKAIALRPFGEAGIFASPTLLMHFSRDYSGGAGSADVSGSQVSIFGRAGVLYAPDLNDELAFSATLTQNWLNLGAYDEMTTAGNLFPAHIAAARFSTPTVKAGVAWTHLVSPDIDFTLSAAVGRSFGRTPFLAKVDWVGPVSSGAEDVSFAELGARVGVKVRENTTANLFLADTVGDKFANHLQLGGGLRINF